MTHLASKKDFVIVSIIGIAFGLLLIPILQNIQPAFWHLNFLNAAGLAVIFFFFANLALWIGSLIGIKIFAVWQFIKFAAIGSCNAALDVGILNLLSFIFKIYSGGFLALFNVISVSIAMANSYFLNKFWAFKSQQPVHFPEVIKFVAVSLASLGLNTAMVYLLTTTIGAPSAVSEPLWENISKIIIVPITLLFNFFGYKYLVFKK